MIIACPKCRTEAYVPEDEQGTEVRCAVCQKIFHADKEQAPVVVPIEAEDDARPAPARPESPAERERSIERERQAAEHAVKLSRRLAGCAMLLSASFTALNFCVNGYFVHMAILNGRVENLLVALGIIFASLILVLMLLVVVHAGLTLVVLRPWSPVVAAIVCNILFAVLFGGVLVMNVFVAPPQAAGLTLAGTIVTILVNYVLNGVPLVLNLLAVLMAARALSHGPLPLKELYSEQEEIEEPHD